MVVDSRGRAAVDRPDAFMAMLYADDAAAAETPDTHGNDSEVKIDFMGPLYTNPVLESPFRNLTTYT